MREEVKFTNPAVWGRFPDADEFVVRQQVFGDGERVDPSNAATAARAVIEIEAVDVEEALHDFMK